MLALAYYFTNRSVLESFNHVTLHLFFFRSLKNIQTSHIVKVSRPL